MQGYSPKLPLTEDRSADGLYELNKSLLDTIKQNFKMLLLTNPGERIMDSNYGVGLRRLLFELDTNQLRTTLISRINNQVKSYMSFLIISDINISQPEANQEQIMFVSIRYTVPSLNIKDELIIEP